MIEIDEPHCEFLNESDFAFEAEAVLLSTNNAIHGNVPSISD